MLRLRLGNQAASLETARLAALEHVASHGLSDRAIYRLEMVLEELLMNVVWHAFNDSNEHIVELSLQIDGDRLALCLEHEGVAFDPLQQAAPQTPQSIAEATPGGLGLALVRKAALDMRYDRADGRNRLRVWLARE